MSSILRPNNKSIEISIKIDEQWASAVVLHVIIIKKTLCHFGFFLLLHFEICFNFFCVLSGVKIVYVWICCSGCQSANKKYIQNDWHRDKNSHFINNNRKKKMRKQKQAKYCLKWRFHSNCVSNCKQFIIRLPSSWSHQPQVYMCVI